LRQDQYLVNPPRHLKKTLRQVVGANVDRPLIHYAIEWICRGFASKVGLDSGKSLILRNKDELLEF
jgi:hypothetical protein